MAADRTVCIYPPLDNEVAAPAGYSAEYTSMSAMEAAENGDLTASTGTRLIVEIVNNGSDVWGTVKDTTAVIFDGWTCDYTSGEYVWVKTVGGAKPDYSSGWDTTAYIMSVNSSSENVDLDNDAGGAPEISIIFDDVQFHHHTTGGAVMYVHAGSFSDRVEFNRCWFDQDTASVNTRIDNHTAADELLMINCVWEGGTHGLLTTETGVYVVNGTMSGVTDDAIETDGTSPVIVNCAVFNNADDWKDAFATAPASCASDDNDVGDGNKVDISPGATEADEWAKAFTDYSNGDYTIKDTNSVLYQTGESQTNQARVPSDDIAGNARADGSESIRAYEYAADGAETYTASGALTSSGASTRVMTGDRTYAGALSFAGAASRVMTGDRTYAGALSFAGAATRAMTGDRTYSGSLSFSGAVTPVTTGDRTYAGALSFSGAVSRVMTGDRTYSGALSFAGAATNDATPADTYTASGSLSFAGAVSRVMIGPRTTSGALSFSGEVATGNYYEASGALSFAGAVTRTMVGARSLSGGLTLAGAVTRAAEGARTTTGALTMSGEVPEAWKEMMYYGVRNP